MRGRVAPLLLPKCHEKVKAGRKPLAAPFVAFPRQQGQHAPTFRRRSWLQSALIDRRKRAAAGAPRGLPGTFDVCLNTVEFGAGGRGRTGSSRWDPDGAARAWWPFRRDTTTSAPSPSRSCRILSEMGGCWDLPIHLDVGRLRTGLVEGAPASTEHVAILLALPGCGDRGMLLSSCRNGRMLLPCASLVLLHLSHLLFLWFLSLVLPAAGERGARAVNS